MFYPIAIFLTLGLTGLAALTKKIRVVWPAPVSTKPRSPEENEFPQSHDPYRPRSEGKNDACTLPSCSDDVCECGFHGRMNFGPSAAEH